MAQWDGGATRSIAWGARGEQSHVCVALGRTASHPGFSSGWTIPGASYSRYLRMACACSLQRMTVTCVASARRRMQHVVCVLVPHADAPNQLSDRLFSICAKLLVFSWTACQ
jgi:hypothetical protein